MTGNPIPNVIITADNKVDLPPSLQTQQQMQKIIKAADDSAQTQEIAVADVQMALG